MVACLTVPVNGFRHFSMQPRMPRIARRLGRAEERPQTLGAEGVLHHVQQGSTLKRSSLLRHLEVDLPASVVFAEGLAHHLGERLQGQGPEDRVLHRDAELGSYPSPERSPLKI